MTFYSDAERIDKANAIAEMTIYPIYSRALAE